MLYHVSEESRIAVFNPRPAAGVDHDVVWAVGEDRLRNYLLPRECPRIAFYANPRTTALDRERFLGSSKIVIAIESDWLVRVRAARLFCYHIPGDGFVCVDRNAGYFQSRSAVIPDGVTLIDDCIAALVSRGVDVRLLPSLWTLHDAVQASTLCYSFIRMRNAACDVNRNQTSRV